MKLVLLLLLLLGLCFFFYFFLLVSGCCSVKSPLLDCRLTTPIIIFQLIFLRVKYLLA